jgi:hypothetical protein
VFQPVCFLGFTDVLFLLKLGLEFPDDLRRDERTDFLKAVILVSHRFQKGRRGLPFFSRQSEFNHQSSVELGVVDGGDAMTFGSFRPPEVRPCGVEDTHEQRRHT